MADPKPTDPETVTRRATRYVRLKAPGVRGLDMSLTRYGRPDAPLFWARPSQWLAWWVRKLADRMDGGTSYAYSGIIPRECSPEDWEDAVEYGASATARYLADLAEERRHG